MADRRQDYERLKRNKDKAERDAILARMAEDKAEKAERERQKKLIASEEEAATSSAASAYKSATSAATTDTSTLAIRAEEGALRHTFPATTTLAEVREWLLQEQARQAALAHGGGSSHVLASNEDIEALRQGRENFERQTARLREEARAMRLAAATGAEGSGATETRLYFVTLMPRAEYLSEEAMATTLIDAGLVPHGTVMVRRQLVAPAPPPDGLSGPDETAALLQEAAEEEEEEEMDEEDAAPAGAMEVGDPEVDDEDGEDDDGEEEDDDEDEEQQGLHTPAGFLAQMRAAAQAGGMGGPAGRGRGRGEVSWAALCRQAE